MPSKESPSESLDTGPQDWRLARKGPRSVAVPTATAVTQLFAGKAARRCASTAVGVGARSFLPAEPWAARVAPGPLVSPRASPSQDEDGGTSSSPKIPGECFPQPWRPVSPRRDLELRARVRVSQRVTLGTPVCPSFPEVLFSEGISVPSPAVSLGATSSPVRAPVLRV